MFLIVTLIDGYRKISFDKEILANDVEFYKEIDNEDEISETTKFYFKIFDDDFNVSFDKLTFYAFIKGILSKKLVIPHESWYYYYDEREKELSPMFIFNKTNIDWLKYEANIEKYFSKKKLFISAFPCLNPSKITNHACNNFTSYDKQKLYFLNNCFYLVSDYIIRLEEGLALTEKGYIYYQNKLIENYENYDNFFLFKNEIYFLSENKLFLMSKDFKPKSFQSFDQIQIFAINSFEETYRYETFLLTKTAEKIFLYFRGEIINFCIKCLKIRDVIFSNETFYLVDEMDKMYVVKKQGDTHLIVRKENIYNCFDLIALIDNDVVTIRGKYLYYRNRSYLLPDMYLEKGVCIFNIIFYNKERKRLVGMTKSKVYFFFVNKENVIILEIFDNFRHNKQLYIPFKFEKVEYKISIKNDNLATIKNFSNLSVSDKLRFVSDIMKNSFETVRFSYLSKDEIYGSYLELYEKLINNISTYQSYV